MVQFGFRLSDGSRGPRAPAMAARALSYPNAFLAHPAQALVARAQSGRPWAQTLQSGGVEWKLALHFWHISVFIAKMVTIHSAYTRQINPEGVTPTLTRAQIWKGLERKVRKAQDFVPVITGCKVLEDKGSMVIREATFKSGPDSVPGQGDMTVREVCNLFEPTRVSLMSIIGSLAIRVLNRTC